MMSEDDEQIEINYATPIRRKGGRLKWVLFVLALLVSLNSMIVDGTSSGGAAGGLWIAFAILHVQD